MTQPLNIALLFKANAAQAKAEVTSLANVTKTFGTQTRNSGNDTRQAAAAMAAYEARIAAMEAELRQLIATQGAANEKARQTKPAFDGGAQSVGYMAAQMNDLFVMTAAGQSPLQMAIQQGTQISQVYGNRGAAGAVQLFKSGFASMLSPLNLGTIAILAGGAALVQWGMSALGAANETKDFQTSIDDARSSIDALNEVTNTYSLDGLVALAEKYGAVDASVMKLVESQRQLALREATDDLRTALGAMTDIVGVDWFATAAGDLSEMFGLTGRQASVLYGNLLAIRDLDSFGAQAAALQDVREQLERAAGGVVNMTDKQYALYQQIVASEDAARQLANSAPQAGWMNAAITGVNSLIGRIGAAISANNRLRSGSTTQTDTGVYGQVGARGDPRAFTAGATGSFNRPFFDVPDTSTGASGSTGGGGGGGGAARAERDAVAELIAKLREEAAVLAELDPVKNQMLRYREQLSTATAAERAEVEALIVVREREKAMDALGEFGANSVVDVLKSIRREGEGASAALKKILNNLFDMGIQALILGKGPLASILGIGGNIFQGGGGGGGGGNVLGFLGGLLGGGKSGGLKNLAAGGMIFGAGGGRDDRVPVLASPGEMMVNARATARHRPLLERINAGLPRFANGGMIGGGAGAAGGADGAPSLTQIINVTGATGNSEIVDMVRQGIEIGVETFSRAYLPQRVLEVQSQPRRRNF